MIGGALLSLIVWSVAHSAPVQASGDDWDVVADPAQRLTTAFVAYAPGQSIIVACRAGELNVIFRGLNPEAGLSRYAEIAIDQEHVDAQSWFHLGDGAAVLSGTPAFHARQFRSGGVLEFGVGPSQPHPRVAQRFVMDLPDRSEGVDQVLTACGVPLSDPRDSIPRWNSFAFPGDSPWVRMGRPEFPAAAAAAGIETGFAVSSCIVGTRGELLECRVEKESDPRAGFGNAAVRSLRSARVVVGGEGGAIPGQMLVANMRFRVE
jgi:hypothetical protein